MAEGYGPALIESRYGPLGSGAQTLRIKDVVYPVSELLVRMGLNFDDSRAIDALALTDGRYVFRYYDGQDQRVVALEFDADFRSLGEVRAQFPEWIGDEEYYPQYCGH
ncbi:MAG TPA: hypothetical protein VEO02_12020 [Thermoanaerobaculia bacterium]|nr:hypothetical protein [Thermoanaerobaculia bacterium]